jgi:hypothetical protein
MRKALRESSALSDRIVIEKEGDGRSLVDTAVVSCSWHVRPRSRYLSRILRGRGLLRLHVTAALPPVYDALDTKKTYILNSVTHPINDL